MRDRKTSRGRIALRQGGGVLESDAGLLDLSIRRANATESNQLADLARLADGNTLSFIARGINPMADVGAIYRDMLAELEGIYSYRNCLVAELDGNVIGMANAFTARLIENELAGAKITAREKHLLARTELNDPQSYLLNSIAIMPAYQRRGIGTRLVEAVAAEALEQKFSSITLHVWADNTKAIAFYQKLGFKMDGHAAIPWHPELPHFGGSLLLRLPTGCRCRGQTLQPGTKTIIRNRS